MNGTCLRGVVVALCVALCAGMARGGLIEVTGFKMPTGAANGYVLTSDASGVGTWQPVGAVGSCWGLGGNAGTTPGTHFLGTTDNQALELHVNGARVMRYEPNPTCPNVIGGHSANSVTFGVDSATIAGGGGDTSANRVTDDYGTVCGGHTNQAGDAAGGTWERSCATVAGGNRNTASGLDAAVLGGRNNTASGSQASIGGGDHNSATGVHSTVAGGLSNTASGSRAAVPGGDHNTAAGNYSFAAGRQAKANHQGAFVWGDSTDADFASSANDQFLIRASGGVGIGLNNPSSALEVAGTLTSTGLKMATGATNGYVLTSDASGVGTWQPGGGGCWSLTGNSGTSPATNFLGTTDNQALELHVNGARVMRYEPNPTCPNVIGGHSANSVTFGVDSATIAGGGGDTSANRVTDDYGTVCGGHTNQAGDAAGGTWERSCATVAGGNRNTASGLDAAVLGGRNNTASGSQASIGGGDHNSATGAQSTVAGGVSNTASGQAATVPGGQNNTAAGNYSFAAGRRAKANNEGSFAWADSTDADFNVSADNRFGARAAGGVYFYTKSDLSAGAYVPANSGQWQQVSDRNVKANIKPVNGEEVLRKLVAVPVSTWRYKGEEVCVRHMGPMAQDLHAAFGLGDSDKSIGSIDADGISFAAIQGLHQLVKDKDVQIADLKERLAKLEALVENLTRQQVKGDQ